MNEWTRPYCGVTHLGKINDHRWVTVIEVTETFSQLTKWSKGCGFSPKHEDYDSVEAAKAAGEKWVREG